MKKVTIDPSCVIDLPRHTFSDHIDFKVFLPSRVEDLPVGIRPIFEPYLRAREILEPFKDAYYQGMADKDALMKVLVSAGDLGDVFLKSVTKVWDMTKPSNVLVGKPFFQQKIEKTEGGE